MTNKDITVNPLFIKLIIGILVLLLGFVSVIFSGAGWAIWNNNNNISVLSSKSESDAAQWNKMQRMVAESRKADKENDDRLRAVEIEQAFQKGFRAGQGTCKTK